MMNVLLIISLIIICGLMKELKVVVAKKNEGENKINLNETDR